MILKTAFAVAAALALTLSPAAAQSKDVTAGTYKMDPAHASLTWKINHLGLSFYTARFTKFDATLDIDPEKPETAKLSVTVDVKSIRTDYPFANRKDFDKELIEDAKFFNAGKFPTITFTSTKVEPTGESTAKVTGDLTLLGVTKPVTLDVTLNGAKIHPFAKKPAMGFSGTTTIKRSEFGMTHLVGPVGDEVQLLIEAEFIQG